MIAWVTFVSVKFQAIADSRLRSFGLRPAQDRQSWFRRFHHEYNASALVHALRESGIKAYYLKVARPKSDRINAARGKAARSARVQAYIDRDQADATLRKRDTGRQ